MLRNEWNWSGNKEQISVTFFEIIQLTVNRINESETEDEKRSRDRERKPKETLVNQIIIRYYLREFSLFYLLLLFYFIASILSNPCLSLHKIPNSIPAKINNLYAKIAFERWKFQIKTDLKTKSEEIYGSETVNGWMFKRP